MVVRLLFLLALGTAMLPFGGAVAFADDGPPRLLSAAGRLRPQETIERVVNLGNRTALLALNGYGSTPGQAAYWDPLFRDLPEFDHFVFGVNRCSYDTLGSLRRNGAELRRCVRELSRDEDYGAVALSGVSQGGATIFSANDQGLGTGDGLTAEYSIDAPLNGSTTARFVEMGLLVAGMFDARQDIASLARTVLHVEIDTQAMRDLARPRTPRVPPGVRALQQAAAGDEAVATRDSEVPRITVHNFIPFIGTGVPAHGGQMEQPRARGQGVALIRGQPVPRDPLEEALATAVVPLVEDIRTTALVALVVGFVIAAVGVRVHRGLLEHLGR